MITAIDTSVLSDIFGDDPAFAAASIRALGQARSEGAVIACDVVWSEVRASFADSDLAREAMSRARVGFAALTEDSALEAGAVWRAYRMAGGSRTRIVPDFLISAHALHQADRLLTRDRGFHRRYFPDLVVMDPSTA